jgi:DNA-binding PadR family transcriptional regulator
MAGTEANTTGSPPLTPAAFHILLALADGERHGYGIMLRIAQFTEQQMRLGPGTLYRSLRTLLESGLIEESGERVDPTMSDERRRYYRLTSQGRTAATAEAARLDTLLRVARAAQLLNTPPEGNAW